MKKKNEINAKTIESVDKFSQQFFNNFNKSRSPVETSKTVEAVQEDKKNEGMFSAFIWSFARKQKGDVGKKATQKLRQIRDESRNKRSGNKIL